MDYRNYLNRMSGAYLDAADWTDLHEDMVDSEEGKRAIRDCHGWDESAFDGATAACRDMLDKVEDALGIDWHGLQEIGWGPEQMGRDLWLTRNGHGAGYWDRGRPYGDELSDIAKGMGESYAIVGDDLMAYLD